MTAMTKRRQSGFHAGIVAAALALAAATGPALDAAEKDAATSPAGPGYLVRNGGFETGDQCPDGWLIRYARKDLSELTDIRVLDNLTLFWDSTASTTGKCIRMDTDVIQKEVHRRMEELIANPGAPRWAKTPTRPPKFDTVAGLEGVSLYSEAIPVEPGKFYRMSVDAMTRVAAGIPMMFVRGYGMAKTAKGVRIQKKLYDTYLACRFEQPGRWQHFEQVFCPTDRAPAVTEIRVMLYAYWEPGLYFWDNVALTEVPEEEAAILRAERARKLADEKQKKARPTPRKHKAGDSFAIDEEEALELPEK